LAFVKILICITVDIFKHTATKIRKLNEQFTLRGKQDWTIHRYTGHKTHSEDKQNKEKHNTEIQKDELHKHPTKNVDEPRCSRRVIISYFA
jgi:hypothetical protein